MYKSSFLWHLARVGRQHPFFTQNVNGANSTALSLVQPKLGLATERSYFSSWGSNGHTASNSGASANPQSVVVAISSDDNQQWERDLRLHRKQFRSIAGIRRYSTGAQTEVRAAPQQTTLHLTGEEAARADEVASQDLEPAAADAEQNSQPVDELSTNLASEFTKELKELFDSRAYLPLVQRVTAALESSQELSLQHYSLVFQALNHIELKSIKVPSQLEAGYRGTSTCLLLYSSMLEQGITPTAEIYELVLQFLTAHIHDERTQQHILERSKLVKGTPQEAFLERNEERLSEAQQISAAEVALQIFQGSNAVRPIRYSHKVLEALLTVCSQGGRIDDAISIFDHYDKIGLQRTAMTYRLLLRVFADAKDLPGAIECFNTWKREWEHLPPHNHHIVYDALLLCYFEVGDVAAARTFFEDATKDYSGQTFYMYENMANHYAQAGLFKEAISFVEGLKISIYSINRAWAFIIKEAAKQDKPDIAREVYKRVTSLNSLGTVEQAPWVYLALLISEGQLEEAKGFIDDCVRANVGLRVLHLSLFITKAFEAGRVEDAFVVARYLGQRRAIKSLAELTKFKTMLLVDIMLADLQRLNLFNAQTIAQMYEIIFMLNRTTCSQKVKQFNEMARTLLPPEEWLSTIDRCNLMLTIVLNYMPGSQYKEYQPNMPFTNSEVEAQLRYLLDILRLYQKQGVISAIYPENFTLLRNAARQAQLDALIVELDSMAPRAAKSSHPQLSLLPRMMRSVLLDETDLSINRLAGGQITRAISLADTKQTKMTTKWTGKSTIEIVEVTQSQGTCIAGDILIKLLQYYGRTQQVRLLRRLLAIIEDMLPRLVRYETDLPAARALLYDHAVVAFNESLDNQEAQRYHDLVLEMGYIPSADAYASFVAKMDETYYRDGATRAMTLFNDAKALGVRPSGYFFNTVIAKLAKARRNDEALLLFEDMKLSGLVPNGVTYGTVINSCCRVGQTEKAEELFREMEARCMNITRIAPYNTLIQHFVQFKKDRVKAFYYWNKLVARAVPPTAHTYRLLIEAHGHLDPVDPAAAVGVIETMQSKRIRVESIHHAAIIQMYGVVLRDLPEAKNYFEYWTSGRYPKLPPDDTIYQSIIEASVLAKDWDYMQSLLIQMQDRKVQLNAYIVNLAIQGFTQSGQLDRARSVFDQLPDNGAGSLGKEPSTYETMIRAYNSVSQPEQSAEILELLKAQHYPDVIVQRATSLVDSTSSSASSSAQL